MNYPDFSSLSPRLVRVQAVFEIIIVSGIVSSFFASLFFVSIFGRNRLSLLKTDIEVFVTYLMLESAITFLFLLMLMKARRETLPMLGLRREKWKTHVLLGIIAAPCLLVVSGAVIMVFQFFLPQYALEKNPLMEMINSPRHLALFIVTGIIGGGIKEELQRAFILNRFRHHLGGAGTGLVVWSLVFGAGHYAQGAQGVCAAAILGLIFGGLYLMRGNLVLPITAHAVYNTLVMLIYWFAIGMNK
jgi:membrane protease YdiL (CAAX protease family)